MLPVEVYGDCQPRFEQVRQAFAELFLRQNEVGAALAVTVDNHPLIDIWAGYTDAVRTRLWERNTIVNLYSVGKAVTALCALRLVEAGRLDLDAPVAAYWPEFAQGGKADVSVRHLLTHEAGLAAVAEPLLPGTVFDWDAMCAALAAQPPWWKPGTQHGYHMNTFGFLVGEVVRRVDGRSLGAFFREEIAGPAGIDFHIGLAPEHDRRTADVLPYAPREDAGPGPPPPEAEEWLQTMREKAVTNPPDLTGAGVVNTRRWRAAEVPSANGHGNARALSRLYGALACGGRLDGLQILGARTIARATEQQVYGHDLMLGRVTRFGLGLQLTMKERPLGPNPRAFGHFGAGGSLGFADPDARLGFGYAMNRGRSGWQHRRVRHLIDLIYAALV